MSGAQGLYIYETRSPASWDNGRVARGPPAPEVYVWWEERTRVCAGVPQAVCCEYDFMRDCFAVT